MKSDYVHVPKKLSGQDYAVIETSNDALMTKVYYIYDIFNTLIT